MVVEDENGVIVDALSDERLVHLFLSKLSEDDLAKTHCLQYIDPYGDTTFNMLQKPVLLREVRSLVTLCDPTEIEQMNTVIAFLEKHEHGIHTYVKFYGD